MWGKGTPRRIAVVESTAAERDAFTEGYANSSNSDGQSTISNARKQIQTREVLGEEPMEVDAIGVWEICKCQRCERPGHLVKDCHAKKDANGKELTPMKTEAKTKGSMKSKPNRSHTKKRCFNCGRMGHISTECRSKKHQDNAALGEEEEEDNNKRSLF